MVLENQQILNAVLIFQDIKFSHLIIRYRYGYVLLFPNKHFWKGIHSFESYPFLKRTALLLFARKLCYLWTISGHCECGEKHPLQCQIARTLNWQIRQPGPARLSAYLHQDNNLHQDCSVPLTRRSRDRVRPAEVTMAKKWSNIDSNDLQCFPRGISWWQCFCACCHLPTGARGLNDVQTCYSI